MALDDYFLDPSQECLARLFDSINSMDISLVPTLSRDEKLIMRVSDRKDVFAEKFISTANGKRPSLESVHTNAATLTNNDHSSLAYSHRDTLVMHTTENGSQSSLEGKKARVRTDSLRSHESASEASFSLGGNPVWVGDESVDGDGQAGAINANQNHTQSHSQRGRKSIDTNSAGSHDIHGGRRPDVPVPYTAHLDPYTRAPKDTHFFSTSITYRGHVLPIKIPLDMFPEEVGDVSSLTTTNDGSYA